MRLLAVAGEIEALIAEIRLRTPLVALAEREGWGLKLRSLHDCTRRDLAEADVLILQRGHSRRAFNLQRSMRQRGGAVVYEIDDLLTSMPRHVAHQRLLTRRRRGILRCMNEADLVTVSTEKLALALGQSDAWVVPNSPVPLNDALVPTPRPGEPISLILASMDPLASNVVFAALRALQVAEKSASASRAFQVVAVGPVAQGLEQAGVEVQSHPLMSRAAFIDFVRKLPNPLALIPIDDSLFSSCKSAIKWFEYSEAGIATLCSALSPYREVIEDTHTGVLVPNQVEAWQAAISLAMADPAWRRRAAEAARQDVRLRHSLKHTLDAWHAALMAATQNRDMKPTPHAGWLWRAQDALLGVSDGLWVGLRRLNRSRLARRRKPR